MSLADNHIEDMAIFFTVGKAEFRILINHEDDIEILVNSQLRSHCIGVDDVGEYLQFYWNLELEDVVIIKSILNCLIGKRYIIN